MIHTETLKVNDKLIVTSDHREYAMIIWRIDPPEGWGKSRTHGPYINAWIRPGGFGVGFDYSTRFSAGIFEVRVPTEDDCEEFIENGSCIHSDHTK